MIRGELTDERIRLSGNSLVYDHGYRCKELEKQMILSGKHDNAVSGTTVRNSQ